jgi:hypothetical protein
MKLTNTIKMSKNEFIEKYGLNFMEIYNYKVYFNFRKEEDYLEDYRFANTRITVLYKDRCLSMNSSFQVLEFQSTDRLTEKQIREDFHNSQFISKIEGNLKLPVKEALKTFKI